MLSDVKPFNLISNIYYVGSKKYCCHVIDTGEGYIMIDTGMPENAEMIIDSMNILGLDVKNVKIILHSHGHNDHTAATPVIKAISGAEVYMAEADLMYLAENTVDHFVKEGDVISLGNTSILCLETPGHTEGTLTFIFDTEYKGKTYRTAMFGGAGTNQLKKSYLIREGRPMQLTYLQREMFFSSIKRLRGEHVDIMLGNHPWNNNTFEKAALIESSEINPFIDDKIWCEHLTKVEKALENIIETEIESEFVNYAHRGASEYAPENTMMAFYLGMYMGANGIETDVRLTKDGVPVLFHDRALERVSDAEGAIAELTYEELSSVLIKKNGLVDKIPTLTDFLDKFAFRPITLAIELKGTGGARPVADILRRYNISHKVVVTSFKLDQLKEFKEYAPEFKMGYLTSEVSDELLAQLRELRIDEICPEAKTVDREAVKKWHYMGFNVRAWGVADTELMKKAYDAGCNGMTVNFPDKLEEYRKNEICEKGADQ